MDNEEDIFDGLDDEVVSSDEMMEEQSNDVPSNSNGGNFNSPKKNKSNKNISNNFKSAKDYEKNNKGTIERLNNVKNKNRMPNSPGIGKEIGNKLTGKNEEEKSEIEKGIDKVGGKATGAAVTAATGGVVNGKVAGEIGDAAFQIMKKKFSNKVKIGLFVGGAFVILIFIVILAMNADDVDYSESEAVDAYVTENMSDDELYDYLKYMGICPDRSVLDEEIEQIDDVIENDKDDLKGDEESEYDIKAVCDYAITYFKRIKKTYNKFKEACTQKITEPKNVEKPCDVTLNIPLLHETMSYGKAYNELWSQKSTPNQKKDIEDLSNAMVEYVHEYCYVNVGKYRDKKGVEHIGGCEGCTYVKPWYQNREWYYFQLSFNKYVSFLKYGITSTHPYYTGENDREVIFGSKEATTTINEQSGLYDHECVGPSNSSFGYSDNNFDTSDDDTSNIDADSSKYCGEVYCKSSKNSGTAHTECVNTCRKMQNKCKTETCKNINAYSSSAYKACMNGCVK